MRIETVVPGLCFHVQESLLSNQMFEDNCALLPADLNRAVRVVNALAEHYDVAVLRFQHPAQAILVAAVTTAHIIPGIYSLRISGDKIIARIDECTITYTTESDFDLAVTYLYVAKKLVDTVWSIKLAAGYLTTDTKTTKIIEK